MTAPVDRTPRPCLHKVANHEHGTRLAYMLDGCRCLPCAAANSAYEGRRIRLKAYGRPTPTGLVDAAPVRAHVEALQAAGMGRRTICARADVPESTVCSLLYGRQRPGGRRDAPSRRINPDVAGKLLALPLPGVTDLAAHAVVDGTGTRRRVQALACIGWSVRRLSAEHGIDHQALRGALRGHQVLTRTAKAVAALYDQLWNTPPTPADEWRDRNGINRTIGRAHAAGWAPPMAWDDESIDDPAASPDLGDQADGVDGFAVEQILAGVRMELSGADLHAAVHALAAAGHQPQAIADRLDIDVRQATRLRDRQDPPRPKRHRKAAA